MFILEQHAWCVECWRISNPLSEYAKKMLLKIVLNAVDTNSSAPVCALPRRSALAHKRQRAAVWGAIEPAICFGGKRIGRRGAGSSIFELSIKNTPHKTRRPLYGRSAA